MNLRLFFILKCNFSQITMCADYHIPQVLAYFMVLQYSPGLRESLKTRHIFEVDDEIVIELRAISVLAVEVIFSLQKSLRKDSNFYMVKNF